MSASALARTAAALAALVPLAAPAIAHESERPMNQVSFQVSSTRDVANDWAVATIGVTEEDSDSARLADRVNETMRWALETAKKAKGVEVRSGGYQTHPVHDRSGKIERWRASQDLRLASGDVEALSKLLGVLQSRLLLRGVSFGVAPETQREVEKELVTEALAAFRARAKQVSGDLGARDHAIVNVNIDTPRHGGPRPMAMEMRSAKAVAPPAFESGESTLGVNVHATIELEF